MFGHIVAGAERALDFLVRRHALIAQNLAHIETPGYRPQELDFRAALEAAFRSEPAPAKERPGHFAASSPLRDGMVLTDPHAVAGRDGNAVDLDRESAKLAENSLRHDAATRILAHRLSLLRFAATDGGHP
jgi:flagellar basal-body rod protein FlgB